MTNLPALKVAVAVFVIFSASFGSAVVHSFQPFMVNWLFPRLTKEELGWRTGYLGLSNYAGKFLGGLLWGLLADNLGRRPSLLLGLIGSIIFETLFGLSQTYTWALFGRFSNGIVCSVFYVVIQPYISEITNEKDQPTAFAILGLSMGLGRIFAPVAGGFLSQLATKHEIFDNKFFCNFPFSLPLLLSVLLYIISFIGAYFVLEETLTKKRSCYHNENVELQEQRKQAEDLQSINSSTDDECTGLTSFDTDEVKTEGCCASTYQHIITVQKDQLTCLFDCISGFKCSRLNTDWDLLPPLKERLLFDMKAIINRSVLSSMAVYAIIGSANVMIYEITILLIISHKQHGGYLMNDNSVGMCFMLAGVVELLYQAFIYARLVKLLGWRKLLIGGVVLLAVATFIFPWGSLIPIKDFSSQPVDQNETIYFCGGNRSINVETNDASLDIGQQPYLVWIIVLVPFAFLMIGRITTLVTSGVLLNNSSIPQTRGIVNGIGYAINALFRAVGYALVATVFAWSQNNGKGWPLNYHFSFILLSILLVIIIPILLSLPKSIETTNKG